MKCICKEDLEDFESNSEHGMHEALFFLQLEARTSVSSQIDFPFDFLRSKFYVKKLNVNVKKDKLVQFNQTVFHSTSTW